MKVRINNLKEGIVRGTSHTFEAFGVSMDPERRYAVAEIYHNELFVAMRTESDEDGVLTGDYVDHFSSRITVPMLESYSVNWDCIKYGFCKLVLRAPERAKEFGGSFSGTVKRFYFDRDLYREKYEEINGVPYRKKS